MPPVHWSDLAQQGNAGSATPSPARRSGPAPASPAHLRDQAATRQQQMDRAAQQNPQFGELLRKREQLEQRMHNALGGGAGAISPRDAARFQVPTMAQRRAEHRAWEQARDRNRPAAPENGEAAIGRQLSAVGERIARVVPAIPRLPMRPTAGERGSASPLDPSQWLAQRDAARSGGGNDEYDRLDQRLDRARSQLSNANPMRDLDRQFEEADRKLAAEGLDSERGELASMKKNIGLDHFNRPSAAADDIFGAFRSTTDRTRDAGERIEQNWLSRRDAIGGQDMESYMRPLREMQSRVLSMSATDFAERSDRLRQAALDRVRERRQEQDADEARRSRALENRRARQNAD